MNDTNIDILIEKTNSLIENLDKYILGLNNQSVAMVDLFTLLSAILAVIISGVSIYVTIRCDKKNRESNESIAEQIQVAENKRAEAAIDANLTANARIEWIQNVRQATAELMTACYKYIGSKADEQQYWEAAQEKKALYVLYFGPDDDGSKETLTNDLFDKKTNKGKNDQLVLFVNNLFVKMSHYHKNHSLLEICKKNISRCNWCYTYNEEDDEVINVYYCKKDEYGTPFDKDDCTIRKSQLTKSLEDYNAIEQDILTNLQNLSEIMRVYGKIEWNRAKEGK